jgi:SAM-dependent methyltransferase
MDVIDLRDFYSRRLGIVARQLINRGIRERWPDAKHQRVLGIGYPTPYLGLFREDAERCIAFMPAAQGVLKWPTARPALATLVDEFSLPLPEAAVDRVLLVHALELSDDPEGLLREVWRVLAPSGRMIAIIPNRRSVTAGLIRARRSRNCCGRPGSRRRHGGRRYSCPRSPAAGSCAQPWRGNVSGQRCRCRSPVCILWKRPNRSIAPFPPSASARVLFRR